jgi:alpha-L-rhamnosidase
VPEDGNQSMSHGWGAQAAVDVLETMLGIRLAAPGAAEVAIVPPRTGLQWARGTRHTQRGAVSVDWKRTREGMVSLEVDVPVNVEARVELPLGGGRRYVGVGAGRPQFLGVRDGRAIFAVGSGRSRFVPLP